MSNYPDDVAHGQNTNPEHPNSPFNDMGIDMDNAIDDVAEKLMTGGYHVYDPEDLIGEVIFSSVGEHLEADYKDAVNAITAAGTKDNDAMLEAGQSLYEVLNKAAYILAELIVRGEK